jgi:hypothetical protein
MKTTLIILSSLILGWVIGQHYPFHDDLIEQNIRKHQSVWDAKAAKQGYPAGYCGHLIKDMAWSYSSADPTQFVRVCQ